MSPSRPVPAGSPRRRAARRDLRVAAVRVLQGLVDGGGSLTQRLPPALEALAPGDRARCQALSFGLARWHIELEAIAARLMDKPLKPKDRDLAWLIELGLYQLLHTEAPPGRVVDETVQATVALDKGWARGLVNAVLRRALREREREASTTGNALAPGAPSTLANGLSPAVRSAHPAWLHARLAADWPDAIDVVLQANNTQAPMTLRAAFGQRDRYLERLRAAGLEAHGLAEAADAIQLDAPVPVERLPGFEAGAASVQDVAAQLAVELLIEAVPPGGRLLDACAAPGGKTGHALQSGHFSSVLALDVDASRLQRVRGTVDRLRSEASADVAIDLRPGDALRPETWWDREPFDAILLDAPCSGTGVIRRHPDIKLLRRERDLDALCATQSQLLDALWPSLAPGGVLLYATCSTLKVENEAQVDAFLTRTPDAQAEPLPDRAGLDRGCGRQRLPGTGVDTGLADGDGFWYARLRRGSSTGPVTAARAPVAGSASAPGSA